MESVDKVTLDSLRAIGCLFSNDDVKLINSIDLIDLDQFISAVCKSLSLIIKSNESLKTMCLNSDLNLDQLDGFQALSDSVPLNFKFAQFLCKTMTTIGLSKVKGISSLGYQNFLYANNKEFRSILMFLVEHLPDEIANNDLNIVKSESVWIKCAQLFKDHYSLPWLPSSCLRHSVRQITNNNIFLEGSIFIEPFTPCIHGNDFKLRNHLNSTRSQVISSLIFTIEMDEISDSLLEDYSTLNFMKKPGIINGFLNNFENVSSAYVDFLKEFSTSSNNNKSVVSEQKSKSSNETEISQNRELSLFEQMQILNDSIETSVQKYHSLNAEVETCHREIQLFSQKQNELLADISNFEPEISTKKRVVDLLPDCENKLEMINDKFNEKEEKFNLIKLEWSEMEAKLNKEIRDLSQLCKSESSEMKSKFEELSHLDDQLAYCLQTIDNKKLLWSKLQPRVDLIKSRNIIGQENYMSRLDFLHKIMELSSSIKKQQLERDGLMIDLISLQKEINLLRGKIERSIIVGRNAIQVEIHKHKSNETKSNLFIDSFESIHKGFASMAEDLSQIGKFQRETRDLEFLIELEKSKHASKKLEKVRNDCEVIKSELALKCAR